MSSSPTRKRSVSSQRKAAAAAEARKNRYNEGDLFQANWLNAGLNEARGLRRLRTIELGVSDFMVDHLRGQLDSQFKQQALFKLLGVGFVQRHFPHHRYEPGILDKLDPVKRETIMTEMKGFLDEKVKMGLEHYRANNDEDRKLTMDVREIFSSDLQAELHKKLVREKKVKVKHSKRRTRVIELKDTTEDRAKFIEDTLNDILAHGPGIDNLIMKELSSRVLILAEVFRHRLFDMLILKETQLEETLQRRAHYGEKIRRALKDKGLTNVSDWEGRRAIDTSVILAYERSSAIRQELEGDDDDDGNGEADTSDDRLVFLTRVLTVAKIADGTFSPTHLFWLVKANRFFPTSRPLPGVGDTREQRALTVAYFFSGFSAVAILDQGEVFDLAKQIRRSLEQDEHELMNHLVDQLKEGADRADPTLYSPDIICRDANERAAVLNRFVKRRRLASQDVHFFTDVDLMFRKWLSEGFVASLRVNACNLVWDYLLVRRFDRDAMMDICLGLFHLLRPALVEAKGHRGVTDVFADGPNVLQIRDLRRVMKHFSKGGDYASIPAAPAVPNMMITPPSARDDRDAKDRRIDALNSSDFFLQPHDD